jgi:hypothetical protein
VGRRTHKRRGLGVAGVVAVACWAMSTVEAQGQSSAPVKVSVTGQVPGKLYPGAAPTTIPVTLTNPTDRALHFARVSVDVRGTGSDACSPEWFRTGAVSIPDGGIAVPAKSSIRLSARGIPGPTIQMRESGTDQNACQAATLTISYAATPAPGVARQATSPARGRGQDDLAFTGFALTLLAAVGAGLTLAGLRLRRG